ncbi:hypothetical protein BS47DRAFT_1368792 [Hydnum rufescens UP504]|uniref:Uncharacterized protein n=1 Tax=Hydnum rufescens UP504 TaxID=1448309 RepID=A0A9P6DH09_9AGAM|nr:hypothetical protein BS47DRAFT_1368792 [Hydnum rufescens UP504]
MVPTCDGSSRLIRAKAHNPVWPYLYQFRLNDTDKQQPLNGSLHPKAFQAMMSVYEQNLLVTHDSFRDPPRLELTPGDGYQRMHQIPDSMGVRSTAGCVHTHSLGNDTGSIGTDT